MKRKIMKAIALGTFVFSGGIAMVQGKLMADTIWVYEPTAGGGTTTAAEPNCLNNDENVCAKQYEYVSGEIGNPTGLERYGDRF